MKKPLPAQQLAALKTLKTKDAVGVLRRSKTLRDSEADYTAAGLDAAIHTVEMVGKHYPKVRALILAEETALKSKGLSDE